MSEQDLRRREERPEKHDEKQEKECGNDRLSAVAWAAVLIWAGLVFLGQNAGLLGIWQEDAWSLILIGAGLIFLLEALARTQLPEYRRPVGGTVVFAVILIAVGLGDRIGWGVVGPIALIAGGAVLLLTSAFRRR